MLTIYVVFVCYFPLCYFFFLFVLRQGFKLEMGTQCLRCLSFAVEYIRFTLDVFRGILRFAHRHLSMRRRGRNGRPKHLSQRREEESRKRAKERGKRAEPWPSLECKL